MFGVFSRNRKPLTIVVSISERSLMRAIFRYYLPRIISSTYVNGPMPIEGSNALNQGVIGVPLTEPPKDVIFLYTLVHESIENKEVLTKEYKKVIERKVREIVEDMFRNVSGFRADEFIKKFFEKLETELSMEVRNKELLSDFFTNKRVVRHRNGDAVELVYIDLFPQKSALQR